MVWMTCFSFSTTMEFYSLAQYDLRIFSFSSINVVYKWHLTSIFWIVTIFKIAIFFFPRLYQYVWLWSSSIISWILVRKLLVGYQRETLYYFLAKEWFLSNFQPVAVILKSTGRMWFLFKFTCLKGEMECLIFPENYKV